jgi:hypothetical protein
MWNGNIIKEFNGTNENAFNSQELLEAFKLNK